MDRQLIRRIENDYPYPIALEFRRLNTKEYLASDENRLRQILKVSETTIHLLSLISIVDLLENHNKSTISIPDSFRREFSVMFTRTSFGKWISLSRECIRIFMNNSIPMFISDLPGYFFEKNGSESTSLKAFNILTSIRNKLSHPELTLTNKVIEDFCIETEKLLETILVGLEFLMDFSFLYVDHISVKYRKWNNPSFNHTFSEVVGNSSEFNAYNKILSAIVNTPAIIIVKNKEENNYLNLDPLMIYSNEGGTKIGDIFMYIDWDKNKTVKYKPVWNGGSFTLAGTTIESETVNSLLKFFEFFAEQDIFLSYKECAEKLNVKLST
jgi:hypothetical protein